MALRRSWFSNSVDITDKTIFKCKYCKKPFLEESSLLRHIGHKAPCKEFYGEEFNDMKTEARLKTKKNYRLTNTSIKVEAERYEREKEKRKIAAKERYRTTKLPKNSLEEKSFERFYLSIYNMMEKEVYETKLFDLSYDAVFSDAYDLSVDPAMNQWEEVLMENVGNCKDWEIEDKYDINTEIENAHEALFKRHLKQNTEKLMDVWIEKKQSTMYRHCWSKGERRARNFFQDFCKDLFPIIEDHAMDFAFSYTLKRMEDLDGFEIDDFELGRRIENNFSYAFTRKEVVDSVIDLDLSDEIRKIVKVLMLKYVRSSCK